MDQNRYEIRGLPQHHSIVLRRKNAGQVWTARIKVRQAEAGCDFGRIERSTGFRDLDSAIAQAHRLYNEILHPSPVAATTAQSDDPSFSEVVALFLDSENAKVKSRECSAAQYERERISLLRHFVPEFGEGSIRGITKRDLSNFLTRRRLNSHQTEQADEVIYERGGKMLRYRRKQAQPSIETLRRERTAFHALMAWAVEYGYLNADDVPTYPKIKGKGARRSYFTPEAIQHLQHVSIRRILDTKHPKRRRERLYCHFRMMTIYLTGCRPQEVALLRFGDIEPWTNRDGKRTYKIRLRPERLKHASHARSVVTLPDFAHVFESMWAPEVGYNDDDFLFATPDRKPLGPCNGSFKELVKIAAAEVPPEAPAAKIELGNPYYSLRHSFITERLYERMDLGEIARLCGTSIEMIQKHYDHVLTEVEQSPLVGLEGKGPYVVPIPPEVWHDYEKGISTLDFYEDHRHLAPEYAEQPELSDEEERLICQQWLDAESARPTLRSRSGV